MGFGTASLPSKKHLHLSFSFPIALSTSWHWLRPGALQTIQWPWLLLPLHIFSVTLHEKLARVVAQACFYPRNGASHILHCLMSSFVNLMVLITSCITLLIVISIYHLPPRILHSRAGYLFESSVLTDFSNLFCPLLLSPSLLTWPLTHKARNDLYPTVSWPSQL